MTKTLDHHAEALRFFDLDRPAPTQEMIDRMLEKAKREAPLLRSSCKRAYVMLGVVSVLLAAACFYAVTGLFSGTAFELHRWLLAAAAFILTEELLIRRFIVKHRLRKQQIDDYTAFIEGAEPATAQKIILLSDAIREAGYAPNYNREVSAQGRELTKLEAKLLHKRIDWHAHQEGDRVSLIDAYRALGFDETAAITVSRLSVLN